MIMKKILWIALALFLTACGTNQEDESMLLEEQKLYFEGLLAKQELEIYELQNQIGELQQSINRLLRDLSTENDALRQELYNATGSFEPYHLDAGRWFWQMWWEWEGLSLDDFSLRIYPHEGAIHDFENYHEIEISSEYWEVQIIDAMREHTSIRIADLWFEETRLVVDLEHAEGFLFNWGSSGGYFRTRQLIDSLATVPNVTEIIVLVGGARGVSADHFSFAQIFRIGDGQWGLRN